MGNTLSLRRGSGDTAWAGENIPEGLAVLGIPAELRCRLRTSNSLERLHREIIRRTRVATLLPNEASVECLVSAVLMEIDEDRTTGRRFSNMDRAA